jgi:hypothetical protein
VEGAVTDAEWQTCADTERIWRVVEHLLGERKTVLFAVAGVRLAIRTIPLDVLDEAVEVAGQAADGLADPGEVERVNLAASAAAARYSEQPETRWGQAHYLALAAERLTTPPVWRHASHVPWYLAGHVVPLNSQPDFAPILRDLVYNPYRDVRGRPLKRPRRLRRPLEILKPVWRTADVGALARGIYESRDFGAMPILADALQDAGCDSEDILNHCRGPGPHVRGCWVVDLVLGKE